MLEPQLDYRRFLGLPPPLQWERLHEELDQVPEPDWSCACSFDPFVVCQVHICPCELCQGRNKKACKWRTWAKEFIERKFPGMRWKRGKQGLRQAPAGITYMQALELQGKIGPYSPRQRNMINIVAWLPEISQNLKDPAHPAMCFDISQSIRRYSMHAGTVQTLVRGSMIWSMQEGCMLQWYHHAKLMGHKVEDVTWSGLNDHSARQMLGNGIHAACAGSVLMGFLAAIYKGLDSQS